MNKHGGVKLNEQQQAFVLHREGPAALLAVPGSGKTTTMVCRTAALIRSGVPAERILTMTFTKAAALDMTRRYAELYGMTFASPGPVQAPDGNPSTMPQESTPFNRAANGDASAMTAPFASSALADAGDLARFSTIHSFALQVIKSYCRYRNRPMPVILAEGATRNDGREVPGRLEVLTELYRELVGGRIGEDTLESLSMAISLAKNTMRTPETASPSLDRGVKGFGVVFAAYEKWKKDHRLVDFDDMLTVCHRILSMDQEMLAQVRTRYDYIQVDEAQDSSHIQHAIIDLIAQPRNNLVLIGDEDQSIYVWRGAHPSGLLGFKERYPDAKIFLMETNYRSRASIVRLADVFIRTNTERTVKNLVAGFRHVVGKPADSDRKTPARVEEEIRILHMKDLSAQYGHLRAELQQDGKGSTAILYRNNRSVYGVADMLDRAGIPFRLRDFKDTLFSHWITRDIRAFVRLMLDPSDREAFFLVAGRMNAYLSKELLTKLRQLPESANVFRQVRKSALLAPFQRTRLEEVEARFKRLARMKPKDALIGLLDCVSYEKALEFAARTQGYAPEYLDGLLDTLLVIAEHQATLADFLSRLDALRGVLENAKASKGHGTRLTLSTVHSAKGLEFDRVFLVDMVEGEFPAADTEEAGAEAEEERRLCYVGITRARHALQVLVPSRRGREKTEPSRFVREMEAAMRTSEPHGNAVVPGSGGKSEARKASH